MPRLLDRAGTAAVLVGVIAGVLALRREGPVETTVTVVAMALGLLCFAGGGIAADRAARAARRSAVAWLAGRDQGQARRGLPPELLTAWARPPTRLAGAGEMAGWIAGGFLLIGGVAFAAAGAESAPERAVGVIAALIGVSLGLLALILHRHRKREKQRTWDELARYAGHRRGRPA